MRIETIEVFPVKIRKEHVYLGETTTLDSPYDYYMRPEYRCPYSKNMETLLVKITTQSGICGWAHAERGHNCHGEGIRTDKECKYPDDIPACCRKLCGHEKKCPVPQDDKRILRKCEPLP